jgi:hypothetical protein
MLDQSAPKISHMTFSLIARTTAKLPQFVIPLRCATHGSMASWARLGFQRAGPPFRVMEVNFQEEE